MPPTARLFLLAVPLALPLVLLAACSGADTNDKFAPACPVPSIPRDTSDLRRFRGAGRDITDSVLDGRVTGIEGTCAPGDRGFVNATVSVGIELTRGPANPGRTADIAYFVAVSEGDRILDKKVYTLRAEFPANTDRLRLVGDQVVLQLPVTATKTAAAYRVSFGFQLTPEELQVNRTRPRR